MIDLENSSEKCIYNLFYKKKKFNQYKFKHFQRT